MAESENYSATGQIPDQPDKGSLTSPKRRLTSVEKARALWWQLQQADWQASQDRALLLDQFNGALPFRPEDLQEAGRPDQYNINFGLGASTIRQHVTSYHDLDISVPVMARPEMDRWVYTKYTNDDAQMFADKLAQGFHRLNKNDWTNNFYENMRLAWNFCFFGIGLAYFPDDIDWRWKAGGLDEWKFPRKQRLSSDTFEYCAGQRYYSAADLISFLGEGEENAKARGWNIEAMKQAMQMMCTEQQYRYNFEGWIKMIKDNDLFYRQSDVQTVPTIRMLVREFDSTYTLLIFTENALPGNDGFLYEGYSEFKCASDAITIFPLEPGLGDIYSVRGYAYQLFETDLARNRFFSILMDNAQNASGNVFKALTQEAMDDFAITKIGNTTVIPPDFEYQQIPMPNFADSLMPIVGVLAQIGQQAIGSYEGSGAPTDIGGGDQRKTASQIKLEAVKGAEVDSAERTNYYNAKGLVYNAQWRRILDDRVSAKTPGGMQVMRLFKWLMEEGVPDEVIRKGVLRWQPVRSMGNGSPDVESIKAQQLLGLSGRFDPNGQNIALRQAVANVLGSWDGVDAFVPTLANPRSTVEEQLATLESIDLSQALVVPVLPGQPPVIHVRVHLKALDAMTPVVQKAVFDATPQTLDEVNKYITGYQMTITHIEQHMQIMASMQPPPPDLKTFTTILGAAKNEFKQFYSVLEKKVLGFQEEAQKAQAEMQQQQYNAAVDQKAQEVAAKGGGPQEAAEKAQLKAYEKELYTKVELMKASQQMKIAQAAADQKLAIERNKAGLDVDNKKILTMAELQSNDLKTQQELQHALLNAPPPQSTE